MAKVLRLDLGEPLASALDDFCKAKHRKKTQLIRELLRVCPGRSDGIAEFSEHEAD
jgi:hypothetical protein